MSYTSEPVVVIGVSLAMRIQSDLDDLAHHLRQQACHAAATDVRNRRHRLEAEESLTAENLLVALTEQLRRTDVEDIADLLPRLRRLCSLAATTVEDGRRQVAETRQDIRAFLDPAASCGCEDAPPDDYRCRGCTDEALAQEVAS